MKKFLRNSTIILLALAVLSTTSGFTISKHFCHRNLISISINSQAPSCCDNAMGNCCHNESKHFQLDEKFSVSSILHVEKVVSFNMLAPIYSQFKVDFNKLESEINSFVADSSPPPLPIQTKLSLLQSYLC